MKLSTLDTFGPSNEFINKNIIENKMCINIYLPI